MADDQHTCGKGLAANSALPAAFGEVMDAVAGNLELHMRALDPRTEAGKAEYEAYERLAERHRAVAAQLRQLGQEMAASHDLPMAEHDMQVMTSREVGDAFERLVQREDALDELLGQRQEMYRALRQ